MIQPQAERQTNWQCSFRFLSNQGIENKCCDIRTFPTSDCQTNTMFEMVGIGFCAGKDSKLRSVCFQPNSLTAKFKPTYKVKALLVNCAHFPWHRRRRHLRRLQSRWLRGCRRQRRGYSVPSFPPHWAGPPPPPGRRKTARKTPPKHCPLPVPFNARISSRL
jgi:hypothetical protein